MVMGPSVGKVFRSTRNRLPATELIFFRREQLCVTVQLVVIIAVLALDASFQYLILFVICNATSADVRSDLLKIYLGSDPRYSAVVSKGDSD